MLIYQMELYISTVHFVFTVIGNTGSSKYYFHCSVGIFLIKIMNKSKFVIINGKISF